MWRRVHVCQHPFKSDCEMLQIVVKVGPRLGYGSQTRQALSKAPDAAKRQLRSLADPSAHYPPSRGSGGRGQGKRPDQAARLS